MLRSFFLRPPVDPAEMRRNRTISGSDASRHIDHLIAGKAKEQHGVVTRSQLLALGLDQDAIDYRLAAGRLHRLHRGVFAVGHAAVTEHAEYFAAVAACGETSGLASISGLAVHGIRSRAEGEDVHVVTNREARTRPGLRVQRDPQLRREDLMLRDGIPVLFPSMALLTAACDLGDRELRRAVNQALVLKRASIPSLVEVIGSNRGRRGVARLARVLAKARPTRSELEDAAVAMLDAYGVTGYTTNAKVGPDEVDVFFPRLGLVLELDGSKFHDNPIQRASDAAKQARLEAGGLRVERSRWRDVTVSQTATMRRLAALGVEMRGNRK